MEQGINWDKENNCLVSKSSKDITSEKIIRHFLKVLSISDVKNVIDGLYQGKFDIAGDLHLEEKKLNLKQGICEKFPFVVISGEIYSYTGSSWLETEFDIRGVTETHLELCYCGFYPGGDLTKVNEQTSTIIDLIFSSGLPVEAKEDD